MTDPSRGQTACPVCLSPEVRPVLDLGRVPVCCNVLWPDRPAARSAPTGRFVLAFCEDCGHLMNATFNSDLVVYDGRYENSLHFSARFQQYAESQARRLASRYRLQGKTVVEVGCGQGDFLRLLCEIGGCRGIGFDPSYVHEPEHDAHPADVTVLSEYYTAASLSEPPDLVCCRHVLEHSDEPRELLSAVREGIGDRRTAAAFLEVPNTLATLRDLAIWDLIYEHPSYFTPGSITRLCDASGFSATELEVRFGGQYLTVDAAPGSALTGRPAPAGREELIEHVEAFARRYERKTSRWRDTLAEIERAGKKAVVWGGGSKGITFLNVLGPVECCEYIVDINPRKHGKFAPGTGQAVVPPEALRQHRPDIVIVMNPIYLDEIGRMLADLQVTAQVVPG